MEAKNRKISKWLSDVQDGTVQLPQFQRHEVWDRPRVEEFLGAIIRDRPLGVFLELEINPDDPPFPMRGLPGVPAPTEKCSRNLLDGQQRLTALWKSLHDQYEKYVYYVKFDKEKYEPTEVISIARSGKQKQIIGFPKNEFEKECVPVRILNPDSSDAAIKWRKEVDRDDDNLEKMINKLRDKFQNVSIPTLALPQETTVDEAINTFIQTNQSAYTLSPFDIAVAMMRKDEKKDLHKFVQDVQEKVPQLGKIEGLSNTDSEEHRKIGDLILKIACLLQGKKPTFGNYRKLDFGRLYDSLDTLIKGFKWSVEIFEKIGIANSTRLPTVVPMRVLPCLHQNLPRRGAAAKAQAHQYIIRYLWCAFLTDRYDSQANYRLEEDYKALLELITGQDAELTVPAFDAGLPEPEGLAEVGWPKGNKLGSAILLAFSQDGALDLSNPQNELLDVPNAEYHHIFPRQILKDPKSYNKTLNAMLLDSSVNKEWLNRYPGDYLTHLIEKIGRKWIQTALASHMLSLKDLLVVKERSRKSLTSMYETFLTNRAKSVHKRIESLARGET